MSGRFADARAAGEALAPLLVTWLAGRRGPGLLLAVEASAGFVDPVVAATGLPVVPLSIVRTDGEARCEEASQADRRLLEQAGTVVVLDRGVETGRTAIAIAAAIEQWRLPAHRAAADGTRVTDRAVLALGVGVCPRQAQPALAPVYDAVLAVVEPLARRSMRWHYADLP